MTISHIIIYVYIYLKGVLSIWKPKTQHLMSKVPSQSICEHKHKHFDDNSFYFLYEAQQRHDTHENYGSLYGVNECAVCLYEVDGGWEGECVVCLRRDLMAKYKESIKAVNKCIGICFLCIALQGMVNSKTPYSRHYETSLTA